MAVIDTQGLSKTYRNGLFRKQSIEALRPLSLTVNQGEVFGLLGPNGAGKTTFIKLLLGIIFPTSGSATILGRPFDDFRFKEKIGYLPENHRYPSYLTGGQVLRYFGELSGLPGNELTRRIPEVLKLVDMERWAKVRIKKYSKGMLQRIGLAQAILNEPDVIFLDEPTDGVDPVGRKEIRDILRRLRDEGKTIFLNSHLLSEVEIISDRVGILNRGELVKLGKVEELTKVSDEYTISVTSPPAEGVVEEIRRIVPETDFVNSMVIMNGQDPERLNRVIDLLRNRSILITSVTQKRTTLEESFISLIKPEL